MTYIVMFLLVVLDYALINNVILSQFYGICPFLGVSKKPTASLGMGAAVIVVILIASAICWPIYQLLALAGIQFMDTITYILVIASIVQLIEMIIKKYSPSLYKSLGVYLPLITTNCAVLGVVQGNTDQSFSFWMSMANALGTSVGFALIIFIFSTIRYRLDSSNTPKAFKGIPIALVTAALMALATDKEDVAGLLAETHSEGIALSEVLNNRIATIGEKLDVRRFVKIATEGQVAGYIHGGGKIGVLVEMITTAKDAEVIAMGRDIAMQVAAMNPKYVSRDDVDQEYIAHETEILTQQALNEGKPANIVEKMIKGRLEKQLKEVCLLEQPFVKNGDLTIKALVAETAKKVGADITLGRVVRFEVGEGIEKKEENFAEEVAKQLK